MGGHPEHEADSWPPSSFISKLVSSVRSSSPTWEWQGAPLFLFLQFILHFEVNPGYLLPYLPPLSISFHAFLLFSEMGSLQELLPAVPSAWNTPLPDLFTAILVPDQNHPIRKPFLATIFTSITILLKFFLQCLPSLDVVLCTYLFIAIFPQLEVSFMQADNSLFLFSILGQSLL